MKTTKAYEYKEMTAAEIARALDDTGLSLGQFCRLFGVDRDWMRDSVLRNKTDTLPHVFRLVFMLLETNPGNVKLCRQLTDAVISEGEEFDYDGKFSNSGQHGKQHAPREAQVEFKGRRR